MIITKNYSLDEEKISDLQVGDFFEYEGELHIIIQSNLSMVYSYNFSKDKIFRFCLPLDVNTIVNVVNKRTIEICYTL